MPITDISSLDLSKSYTYADYLLWRFKERIELIKGKIVRMSPAPSSNHQRIVFELSGLFYNALKKKPCQAFVAPFDVRFIKSDEKGKEVRNVVQPDLCVVCDANKIDKRGCLGAPDLVVEILSPGNSQKEMLQKYELYEEFGVREYWVVNPMEEHILLFVAKDEGKFIGLKPVVKGGTALVSHIFPDLIIPLDEVFPDRPESDNPDDLDRSDEIYI